MIIAELLGGISDVEVIAVGSQIREIGRLRRVFGPGRWRKMKGFATVRIMDGSVHRAEIHWYEAHGIGRVEFKAKRLLS